jgi:DNA mismatch endonuclease, patch repair protein
VDHLSKAGRSKVMSSIRSRNTRPELEVRKYLHARGYRFRIHADHLPGKPDVVLPKYRLAIWIHGCFWHAHRCKVGEAPSSNTDYWGPKLARNVSRDLSNKRKLNKIGWRNFVIWECQILCPKKFSRRVRTLERVIKCLGCVIEPKAVRIKTAGEHGPRI